MDLLSRARTASALRAFSCCAVVASIFAVINNADAQSRQFGAGAVVLDDAHGHSVTLVAPQGMESSYTYTFPDAQPATVLTGTNAGQMIYWDGQQWAPMNFAYFDGDAIGLGFASIPQPLPFAVTLGATTGPAMDAAMNLGDATHRFDTIFAASLVGSTEFVNLWARTGNTIAPSVSGDSISVATEGGLNLTGPASPILADGSPGETQQVLTSNGWGVTPTWQYIALPFSQITTATNNDATMTVGEGAAILTEGGTVEATQFKASGSTSDAVDLGTSEVSGILSVLNGGTGAADPASARNALGAAGSSANTDITSLSGITTPLAVGEGGTGANNATGARTSLSAARLGANSDITSLNGLTTPLAINEGGTGANTAANARASLSVAVRGVNNDITSLVGLTTALPITEGGTGASSATNARLGLGAATSGANADITSLSGLTTALPISEGGTGQTTAQASFDALSPMTTTGDVVYAGVGGAATRLPGNTALSRKFLSQTGDGTTSAAPQWNTLTNTDLASSAVTVLPGTGIAGGGTVILGDSITITNAGVTSLTGTLNQVIISAATGSVTLSTPQNISSSSTPTFAALSLTSPLTISNGGTGASSVGANLVFAGPNGSAGAPGFRSLGTADIPSLASSYIVNGTSQQSSASFNIGGSGAIGTTLQVGPSALNVSDQFGISKSGSTTLGGIGVLAGDAGLGIGSRTSGKELQLYATGAGPATIYTNGSERLRIDGSGKVGIGVSIPGELLDVRDGNLLLSNTGTASQLELQGTSSGISSFSAGAQGTTTIHYTLPTTQPSANDVLTASTVTGAGPYNVALGWSAPAVGGGSGWGLSGNSIASGDFIGTTNAQDLVLETNAIERVRVSSAGKVGIGAPAPNEALEVKDGNILLSNSGTAKQLQLQGTGSGITSFQSGAQGAANITYTLPTTQGVAGSMLQNNGSGALTWASVGQVGFGRRTENFNITSSSLQSDTSLVVTLAANATYTFTTFLTLSDPNSAGVGYAFAFNSPASSTLKWGFIDPTVGLGTNGTTRIGSGTQSSTITLSGSSEYDIWVQGIVVTTTSGPLQFRLRKVTGGTATDPVRINPNSYLQVTRVQ
jgi:hypothetical protein